jgi:hypothetical protein
MNRIRTAILAWLTVTLLFGAVACGDDDADAFKEDYNAAVRPLSEANSEVTGAIQGETDQSNAAIAKQFQGLAQKTRRTRDNLRELEPPEDAKEAYDELLAALENGTDDLRAVAEAAKDADPAAAREARDSLEESAQDIKQAESRLQDAVDNG